MSHFVIYGKPHPQARGRAVRRGKHAGIHPDPKSQDWKGMAQTILVNTLKERGVGLPLFPDGPVKLTVLAVFPCPKGDHRKREKTPRRWHAKRGDADNIAKSIKDAANGVLWTDDGQVAQLRVLKTIGAQDEGPRTEVWVERQVLSPDYYTPI